MEMNSVGNRLWIQEQIRDMPWMATLHWVNVTEIQLQGQHSFHVFLTPLPFSCSMFSLSDSTVDNPTFVCISTAIILHQPSPHQTPPMCSHLSRQSDFSVLHGSHPNQDKNQNPCSPGLLPDSSHPSLSLISLLQSHQSLCCYSKLAGTVLLHGLCPDYSLRLPDSPAAHSLSPSRLYINVPTPQLKITTHSLSVFQLWSCISNIFYHLFHFMVSLFMYFIHEEEYRTHSKGWKDSHEGTLFKTQFLSLNNDVFPCLSSNFKTCQLWTPCVTDSFFYLWPKWFWSNSHTSVIFFSVSI